MTVLVILGYDIVLGRPDMRPLEKSCPASTGLTPRQRECLDAIEAHLAQTRTMPSIEELRVACNRVPRPASIAC
jgi:hypothetical protein